MNKELMQIKDMIEAIESLQVISSKLIEIKSKPNTALDEACRQAYGNIYSAITDIGVVIKQIK